MRLFSALGLFALACSPAPEATYEGDLVLGPGRIGCAEGSLCAPIALDLPETVSYDLVDAPHSVVLSTSCAARGETWEGGEMVFEVDVPTPGALAIALSAEDDVQVFLLDRADDDTCIQAGSTEAVAVRPGSYWLLVDAKTSSDASRPFRLGVAFSTDFVADDNLEPNDEPDQATGYYVDLFDTRTIRATLTPDSRLDWYELQVSAGAVFHLDTDAPTLHVENDDEEPLAITRNDDGTWHFEDRVHNRDRTYWVKIELPEDAPANAWADYTLTLDVPETNPDAWD